MNAEKTPVWFIIRPLRHNKSHKTVPQISAAILVDLLLPLVHIIRNGNVCSLSIPELHSLRSVVHNRPTLAVYDGIPQSQLEPGYPVYVSGGQLHTNTIKDFLSMAAVLS